MTINVADYQSQFFLEIDQAKKHLLNIDALIKQAGDSAESSGKSIGDKLSSGLDRVSQFSNKAKISLAGIVAAGATVESGLVDVAKTTGIEKGTDDFENLEKAILGVSRNVPVLLPRLFEIAEAAGTVGVQGVKDVEKFTSTIAKLDLASQDLKGADAASSLKTILDLSKEGLGSVDELASSFVVLGNNYNTTEGQAAALAIEVAKGLQNFSIGSKDVVAFAGALSEIKIPPELARSGIGALAREFDLAFANGGEELQKFAKVAGVSGKEFEKVFKKNSANAIKLFLKGLKDQAKAGVSVTKNLDDLGLKGERFSTVISGLVQQYDRLGQIQSDVNKEYENASALNEEASNAGDTFAKKMVLMGNALTELGNSLAKSGLLDFLTQLISIGTSAVLFLSEMPEPLQAVTVGILGFVAAAPSLIKVVDLMKFAIKNFDKVLKRTIIGAVLGAIVWTVQDLWKAWNGGDSVIKKIIMWFKDMIPKAVKKVINVLDEAWESVKRFFGFADEDKEININVRTNMEEIPESSAEGFRQTIRDGGAVSRLRNGPGMDAPPPNFNVTIEQNIHTNDPVTAANESTRQLDSRLSEYGM